MIVLSFFPSDTYQCGYYWKLYSMIYVLRALASSLLQMYVSSVWVIGLFGSRFKFVSCLYDLALPKNIWSPCMLGTKNGQRACCMLRITRSRISCALFIPLEWPRIQIVKYIDANMPVYKLQSGFDLLTLPHEVLFGLLLFVSLTRPTLNTLNTFLADLIHNALLVLGHA